MERLSSGQWVSGSAEQAQPRVCLIKSLKFCEMNIYMFSSTTIRILMFLHRLQPTCDNHDDGETSAIILCNECGNLCADCDRFLHLHRRTRSHQRQVRHLLFFHKV